MSAGSSDPNPTRVEKMPSPKLLEIAESTDVESLIADLTNDEAFRNGGYDNLTVAQAVRAAMVAEKRASKDDGPNTTKRWAGGVFAVLITCGGSLYAWTNDVVTQGKLDATVAPIEDKLESQGQKLKEVSDGVDDLLQQSERRRQIDKAKLLVDKLGESYEQQVREWDALPPTRKKTVRKPTKSPALLTAESELESLLSK